MKKVIFIYICFYMLIIWTIFVIFIQILQLKNFDIINKFFANSNFTDGKLFLLLNSQGQGGNILEHFFDENSELIHFYNLPKRKSGLSFAEVTSANRDGRHSLASDFSFFVEYGEDWVTLVEDIGCGCINRIYLYPPLPTDMSLYKFTPADLHAMFIQLKIDDNYDYEYSLKDLAEAEKFPFLYPMSSKFFCPVSGISSYSPICYNTSIRIRYKHHKMLPKDLFNLTINCSLNELRCPVKMYSGISLIKFPMQEKCPVKPFHEDTHKYENQLLSFAKHLRMHSAIEPDLQSCWLQCATLNYGESITIFQSNHARVINLLRFNVLQGKVNNLIKIWNNILLTVKIDSALIPNINKVPLSALFGSREFKGASFGRKLQNCYYKMYSKLESNFYGELEIGYFLLPIPYWSSAEIILEFSSAVTTNFRSLKACYQVNTVPNYYHEKSTANLQIEREYYRGDVSKTRQFFSVEGEWGHIVGLLIEIENLQPHLDGPSAATWAALQSDLLIYIDGVHTPVALGTGLEDYFSYAHGFANAMNTSFSFVGLHHSADKGDPNIRSPIATTRHCYRQHLLDPIIFNSRVRVVMEGMDDVLRFELVDRIRLDQFEEMRMNGEECFAYNVIYYLKQLRKYEAPLKEQSLGVADSLKAFNVDRLHSNSHNEQYKRSASLIFNRAKNCASFFLCSKKERKKHTFNYNGALRRLNYTGARFIGDVTSSKRYSGCAVGINNGTTMKFVITLPYKSLSPILSLARTSYCLLFQKSSLSEISINHKSAKRWFFQMGCLNREYSLIEQSLNIEVDKYIQRVSIEISQLTNIYDVSYELCEVP